MSELVQFAKLQRQMRADPGEMVPKRLAFTMFALMFLCVALVAYAKENDVPKVGVLVEAPIVDQLEIVVTGDRVGVYTVHDTDGNLLVTSSDHLAGFIGVIGRVIERDRKVSGVTGNPSMMVVRRDNGNISIIDDSVGLTVELIGYGKDNVAAFAKLLD